jgi:hypothetical protein
LARDGLSANDPKRTFAGETRRVLFMAQLRTLGPSAWPRSDKL